MDQKYMDQATVLTAKSSVGVTPDVNLSNPLHTSKKAHKQKVIQNQLQSNFFYPHRYMSHSHCQHFHYMEQ